MASKTDPSGQKKRPGDGVTRRDFLHDVSLASLALALPRAGLADSGPSPAAAAIDTYYPPTETGLRGTHAGAFEVAHQLAREGKSFAAGQPLNEDYDLIVVGGGISGLAAAYFFRQQHGPDSRILILDNHDDFGGHAKRNEFHQGGPMRLAWGGTVNIEHWKYSAVGNRLLSELGIDIPRLLDNFRFNWGDSGTGLKTSTWFDRATYGRDVLIPDLSFRGFGRETILEALPRIPISPEGKAALRRFLGSTTDALPGYSAAQRQVFLHTTRYADFLREQGGLTPDAIQIFSASMPGIWGVRADDLSVAESLESGLPGAHILALPEAMAEEEPDHAPSAMFPDGNASIARLLVRALIPSAFPGMHPDSDPFDIVTAALDYGELDQPGNPVRLRLNSTVLEVGNSDSGEAVNLSYHRDGKLEQLSGSRCVLACYNRIIPHLCPTLPEAQQQALAQCIKRPMATVNVLLDNGHAIQKSGVSQAYLPGSFLQLVTLVTGIDVGPYRTQWDPADPCVLHFFAGIAAEQAEGLTMVEQSQAGRARLLGMDFADFEHEVHRVLAGIWGPSGLDPATDIHAITVNRWPHGYARDLLDLEDPAWLATPGPYEIGRQTFGNIAIANSDAGADAYTHTAIDQAWRAVQELPQG